MRTVCFVFVVLVSAAAPALAQVTVDLHALDALPGARSAPPPTPAHKPARRPRPAPRRQAGAKPAQPAPPQTAASQPRQPAAPAAIGAASPPPAQQQPPPAQQQVTLPNTPPPTVALAPIAPPAPGTEPATPPPPPPISDTAKSAAKPTHAGLTVSFGAGQADLSPASAAAIKTLVQGAPSGGDTSFNVIAYAAGTPEDPSTARRLSLSRALAVRSALMADGVGSSRIYVRALGAQAGEQVPDRVDVAVLGTNAPAAAPASTPAPSSPGSQSHTP